MIYGAVAAFELGVIMMVIVVVLLASTHPVFADSYEKTQTTSQVNECGNYWFPLNVLCSNVSSQVQGDENSVAVATRQAEGKTGSSENFTPFP